jgi:hypothetical protein
VSATATFYTITGNSDYYWRVTAPAKVTGAKFCSIPEEGGFYALTEPNDDTPFTWTQDEDGLTTYPCQEGPVAVWTRPDIARATHAKAMRELHGIRTIAETDDNYISNPKFNIYMRSNGFDEKLRVDHMKAAASMDGVVFSTSWLRDYYYAEFKKQFRGIEMPESFVCRNHVLLEDWPERVESDGPVRVGWMGSPSHVADVNQAWAAMMHARNIGCDTFMIGYDPADPECAMTSDRAFENVEAWERVGHTHIPWRRMDGESRIQIPLDIGLCPLLSNAFTFGKSDVKFLEYTIAGAACIAQNNLVYNRTVIHGETGLLVGGPQEMLEAVELLARDENLRQRLVTNAQQYVREERGEKQIRAEWTAALDA